MKFVWVLLFVAPSSPFTGEQSAPPVIPTPYEFNKEAQCSKFGKKIAEHILYHFEDGVTVIEVPLGVRCEKKPIVR